ncbi:serine/threonine-protein kinase [Kitasatospora sp. NPDC006697]|uniref:serine/threonine-protein kinase n=1 Tax=Kitasatospora sp. NPDC006697 TaxID=3364020 RepID=UPI0036CE66F4
MEPLLAGDPTVVGPYQVLRRLGAGGMGQVYLGRSRGGRAVAIKRIKGDVADPEFRIRFRREVAAVQRVGKDWTAAVLDADSEAPEPWVATVFIPGLSLQEAVAGFGPLAERDVLALAAGLAESLAWVHARGLIHRDIKPGNVMLSAKGPQLIDFGIARAMDGSATTGLTQSGVLIGTLGFMSPEQVQGQELGGPSDVFQLGAVLFYAATGRGPFTGANTANVIFRTLQEEPDLGALQGPLRQLVTACLAKDPARRPTPAQLAAWLAPQGAAALRTQQGWLGERLLREILGRATEVIELEVAASVPDTQRLGPTDAPPAFVPPPVPTYVPSRVDAVPVPAHLDAVPGPSYAPNPPAEPPEESEARIWFKLIGTVLLMSVFIGLVILVLAQF